MAQTLGMDGTVVGTLARSDSGGGDIDMYIVDVDVQHRPVLVMDVTGVPGVDVVLEVLDGAGRVVARADAGGEGEPEMLPNVRTDDVAARVVVRSRQDEGAAPGHNDLTPYELTVRRRSAYLGEELEPNDAVDSAAALDMGRTVVGLMGTVDDRDIWAFAPPPGGAEITLAGVPGVDVAVSLLDAGGQVIARIDDSATGGGEQVGIGTAGPWTATRFVSVDHVSGAPSHLVYFLEAHAPGAAAP